LNLKFRDSEVGFWRQNEASLAVGRGRLGLQDLRAVFRGRGLRGRDGLPPELVLSPTDLTGTHLQVLSCHQGIGRDLLFALK